MPSPNQHKRTHKKKKTAGKTKPSNSPPTKQNIPPFWVHRLPAKIFPRGPRALYSYLCAFPSGVCYLFTYRLAQKFHVSDRTIRRWRSWLTRHNLCHTFWESTTRPRIVPHHFKNPHAWLIRMATPGPARQIKKTHLNFKEKEARRQLILRQLALLSGRTKLSP
jgi:hypothetical protein